MTIWQNSITNANDFLNVFSKEDAELFKDIDNLIDGEVTKIDYIKTNHGNR